MICITRLLSSRRVTLFIKFLQNMYYGICERMNLRILIFLFTLQRTSCFLLNIYFARFTSYLERIVNRQELWPVVFRWYQLVLNKLRTYWSFRRLLSESFVCKGFFKCNIFAVHGFHLIDCALFFSSPLLLKALVSLFRCYFILLVISYKWERVRTKRKIGAGKGNKIFDEEVTCWCFQKGCLIGGGGAARFGLLILCCNVKC